MDPGKCYTIDVNIYIIHTFKYVWEVDRLNNLRIFYVYIIFAS